jgi:hypothetical protein
MHLGFKVAPHNECLAWKQHFHKDIKAQALTWASLFSFVLKFKYFIKFHFDVHFWSVLILIFLNFFCFISCFFLLCFSFLLYCLLVTLYFFHSSLLIFIPILRSFVTLSSKSFSFQHCSYYCFDVALSHFVTTSHFALTSLFIYSHSLLLQSWSWSWSYSLESLLQHHSYSWIKLKLIFLYVVYYYLCLEVLLWQVN